VRGGFTPLEALKVGTILPKCITSPSLHDVFLAFARLAGFLGAGFALEGDVVVVGDGLGADEALLEIGVDDAGRLRALVPARMVQARASFGPTVK
jgi:hypothetical protein